MIVIPHDYHWQKQPTTISDPSQYISPGQLLCCMFLQPPHPKQCKLKAERFHCLQTSKATTTKHWHHIESYYKALAPHWKLLQNIGTISKATTKHWHHIESYYKALAPHRKLLQSIDTTLKATTMYWHYIECYYKALTPHWKLPQSIDTISKATTKHWHCVLSLNIAKLVSFSLWVI